MGRVFAFDKSRKEFELDLVKQPLVTDAMSGFNQTLDIRLANEQADVLALALSLLDIEQGIDSALIEALASF